MNHIILIFRVWLNMSKSNQMIKFELNWSSGNVITQIGDCCHGYKISIVTKIKLASFCRESDQLAKYELHICNDIYLQFYCKHAAILPHKSRLQTKSEKLEWETFRNLYPLASIFEKQQTFSLAPTIEGHALYVAAGLSTGIVKNDVVISIKYLGLPQEKKQTFPLW